MYKNAEVEELKKKVILCIIVFIFVITIGLLFIFNRLGSDVDAGSRALQRKETFVVFFTDDNNCDSCSLVKEELNALGVSYYNFDVKASSYQSVLKRMKVDYEVRLPAIYVLIDGEVSFNITNIETRKMVRDFIQNNNVISLIGQES